MADFDDDIINVTNTSLDDIDTPLVIPVNKLDADQYSAEDIDGVTESIFGSGNMAYASLQASQTDSLLNAASQEIAGADGFIFDSQASTAASGGNAVSSFTPNTPAADANTQNFTMDTDRGLNDQAQGSDIRTGSGAGNFTAGTVGSVSASQLSSDTGSFASTGSGLSLGDGLSGESGVDGSAGSNGSAGANGQDGQNGGGGDGTTIINNETVINLGDIDLGDINLGDIDFGDLVELVDNVFINLGDTITTVTTTLTEITNILDTILNNDTINNILDLTEVTNIVTNLTETLTTNISNVLTEVTNITENITNLLGDISGGDGIDPHIILDVNLLDSLITSADIPLFHLLDTDLDLNVNLTPTLDFVDELASTAGLDIVSDALGDLAGVTNLLQNTINDVTDVVSDLDLHDPTASIENLLHDLTDLEGITNDALTAVDDAVGNLLDTLSLGGDGGEGDGLVSQTLDPVVGQVGDVLDTLTGGMTTEVTDALDDTVDTVTDIVDNLTGGLTDGLLGQNNDNDDGADSDISLDLDIAAIDALLADNPLDVALDPLEDLIGDVDLGIGLGADLLGSGGEETDNDTGDSDITLNTNIDLIDNTLGGIVEDIPLDSIEELVGDIDLDIGAAVNLLGDLAAPIVNDGEGGSGEDTLLANIGDGLSDALQDPVDGLVDGLGLENILGDDDSSNDDGLISDTLDPVIEDVGDVIDTLTGGATDQLTDDLTNTVDAVSDIADDLTGGLLGGLLGQNNDNEGSTDSDVETDLGLDILDQTIIDNPLDVALDPVEDLIGDVDIGLDLDAALLGSGGEETDNDAGDTDITIDTNIEVIDNALGELTEELTLDPVEEIVGDVDIDLDSALDVLGDIAAPLVNDGEGGTGEDTLLAEVGDEVAEILDDAAEELVDTASDIVEGGTDLLGGDFLGNDGEDEGDSALLDHIDDVLDIGDGGGLDDALDLLHIAEDDGDILGEDALGEWTETTLDGVGGVFDDLVDGLGGAGDVLPDPVGTIAEGLGILDTDPDTGSGGGLLGGLFG